VTKRKEIPTERSFQIKTEADFERFVVAAAAVFEQANPVAWTMVEMEFDALVREARSTLSICVPYIAFIVEDRDGVRWEEVAPYSSRALVLRINIASPT
jgi:hypothetical protein